MWFNPAAPEPSGPPPGALRTTPPTPQEIRMNSKFDELKARLLAVYDLNMAGSLLRWDQTTYMPPGGAEARGRQQALLGEIAHQRLTDPEVGRLLDAVEREGANWSYDSDEAGILRVARREYDQASRVPSAFVSEMNTHFAHTYQVWTEARPANDYSRVRPLLEKT